MTRPNLNIQLRYKHAESKYDRYKYETIHVNFAHKLLQAGIVGPE